MATVYRAFDTRLERDVAIKIIRKEKFGTEAMPRILKRFEREAKALAHLSHPNIVGIMDHGEHDGTPYLVMAFIPSGTLKGQLGKQVPYQQAAKILIPIARALAYAHQQKIIHRDVKPGNILITTTGDPMLSDFGIAKILDVSDETTLTETGVGIGTPEYMAPEQAEGKADHRSDIYALGIVFYELITGKKPFTADTPFAVLLKHAKDPLPRPKQYVPSLPDAVERAIFKVLEKNPSHRYQTMTEFANALEKIASDKLEAFAPAISDTTVDEVVAPRRTASFNPVTWIATAAAIAVGVICLIVAGISISWLLPNLTRLSAISPAPAVTSTSSRPASSPVIAAITTPTNAPTATRTLTPTPSIAATTQVSSKDASIMVFVPAGEFTMGGASTIGDRPVHKVYLDAFWIDQTEATNAMFNKFVSETNYVTDAERARGSYIWTGGWTYVANASWRAPFGPNSNQPLKDNQPVTQVSWNDANAYCKWAKRRLPTEAEWEKAARGSASAIYPWGNSSPTSDYANYGNNVGGLSNVGQYLKGASQYGALDMAGNVYEWVNDWYAANFYSSASAQNPTGPVSGDWKIMKGGSWQLDANRLHAFEREVSPPNLANTNLGFRCASSTAP
jgi:serine/threonine-protein kinase